jgi:UDP-2,4-diacetamido-2,4,6-trideoxy-beta-L-altropyranose hydrolase
MFAVRISNIIDKGIGHLMRMKHLADALTKQGSNIVFILDQPCEFSDKLLNHYIVEYIAEAESNYSFNEQNDAGKCVKILARYQCQQLILDSYCLGYNFEQVLKRQSIKVIVFDDNEREHFCDVLVDQKWTGRTTAQRYQNLVAERCERLLGPQYAILDPQYCDVINSQETHILFSLGGGGDLLIFTQLWQHMESSALLKNIIFDVVVGPRAENSEAIDSLAEQYSNINIIKNSTSLAKYYARAKLFVGALGTSFYECSATSTPAITFSLSDNQQNDNKILEYLGHYLHLGSLDTSDFSALALLIESAYQQVERLIKMQSSATIQVDGKGAHRLASILLGCEKPQELNFIEKNYVEGEMLTNHFKICPVTDTEINYYLLSRNRENNSERMTIATKIKPIEHYLWWFSQSRENYLLVKKENDCYSPVLYIWQQTFREKYLYGGWFTCGDNVGFSVAMLVLKWQLLHCKNKYPGHIWLAVINKKNGFVNLLNQYMGFKAVEDNSIFKDVTQEIFPQALDTEFNFVYLK